MINADHAEFGRGAVRGAWITALAIVTCIVTAAAAIYVEMGAAFAIPLAAAAVVALVAWLRTTYRYPGDPDLVVVLYIAGIIALIVVAAEQWHRGTPAFVMRAATDWIAPGFVFDERPHIAMFAIACPALFLLGGFSLVRGRPLGDYMAWLLFVWSLVAGAVQGTVAVTRDAGPAIATGIAAAVPLLCVGTLGVRRLIGVAGARKAAR